MYIILKILHIHTLQLLPMRFLVPNHKI